MISVIIPAHNEEGYIRETLRALEQAKKEAKEEVEYIVVCNGCSDNTSYAANGFSARIIETENKGVSFARNLGASLAKFPLLVFLDADTLIAKGTLQKILDSNYKLGTCKAKPDKGRFAYKAIYFFKNRMLKSGYYFGLIFCDKEIFEKAGRFNEGLNCMEGRDFNKKAMKFVRFGVIDSPLVVNSMRRYENLGVFGCLKFWIRALFAGKKAQYPVIR
ncbi:glycosyltransferase [archaeon]|nr:glycosyltransferase [archaeon]